MPKTSVNAANFNTKLSGWKRSALSLRATAGEILDFGFDVYADTGDAGYLSRMCAAALDTKGVNASRMIAFVSAHANVTWGKGKDGALRFAKSKKGDAPTIKPRDGLNWWEWNKQPAAADDYDLTAALKRLAKKVRELDDDIELKVDGLQAALRELTDAVNGNTGAQAKLRLVA